MKKQNFSVQCVLGLFLALGINQGMKAQLAENMGTGGPATETIAARETANRFSEVGLTYSGTADARNTTVSSGYPGASGGHNIFFNASETFIIEGVDAASCGNADSLVFGIFKSTNASNGIDFFTVEVSSNSGAAWTALTWAPLPVASSGTAHWYRRAAALPAAFQVANLWIRFRSTLVGTPSSTPQFRIDDVLLTCSGGGTPCGSETTTVTLTGPNTYCAGGTASTLTASTTMSGPSYQWYNQDGIIVGATGNTYSPTVSGSYYVQVTNADECESTSAKTYILVYPQPTYCTEDQEGCAGGDVEACVDVQAQGLIFSQYVEGSSLNKYLEIYNGTCKEIDLAGYQLRAYHNGASVSTPTYIIPLTGLLANNATYVIANPGATAYSGTPDLVSNNLQFNGDDALALYDTLTQKFVDIIGSIGHDPGSSWRDNVVASPTLGWSTVDLTLVRKACVYSGIGVNPDLPGITGFPTLTTEWDTLATDDVTGLGSHDIAASSYTFSVVSGGASIISNDGGCVFVTLANGSSIISVNGVFCTFNDCADANNTFRLTGDTCETRSAVAAGIRNAAETTGTQVFPNPFTNDITVSFNNAVAGKVDIRVMDMYGKTLAVLGNQHMEAGAYQMNFDISTLAAGTYIVRIQNAEGQETVRIVKSK